MAIVGAIGKMGSWFVSYFAHRGLDVSAFDINQKILKPSDRVKIQNSLADCVKDADFVLVCVLGPKNTTSYQRMHKKHEGWSCHWRNFFH